jgi:predicted naringenin-chalcone synthase
MVHQMAALGRTSLVVACELSSLHFQYTDALDQLTANVLFSDGAAAMTLSTLPAAARVVAACCAAVPQCADQMVWFADDHGLRLRLSQDLPDTLAAHVPRVVGQFLSDSDTSLPAIDHWLVHPGGPQILDAVRAALGLRADALHLSRSVLSRYGNMSSPTIFFILQELLAARVDGQCVAMAFGPGLTVELVLLEIKHNA